MEVNKKKEKFFIPKNAGLCIGVQTKVNLPLFEF